MDHDHPIRFHHDDDLQNSPRSVWPEQQHARSLFDHPSDFNDDDRCREHVTNASAPHAMASGGLGEDNFHTRIVLHKRLPRGSADRPVEHRQKWWLCGLPDVSHRGIVGGHVLLGHGHQHNPNHACEQQDAGSPDEPAVEASHQCIRCRRLQLVGDDIGSRR